MSSHRLSVSGDRPWTHSAGGGVAGSIQYPAREGDGVQLSLSSVEEITIPLDGGARIEKRRYAGRGDRKDTALETYVLVMDRALSEANGFSGHIRQSINVLGRCDDGHPVSNVDIRKRPLDEPDNAWAGWGDHEVLGAVVIPRYAMGDEEIHVRGGSAPAYVGEADMTAKLDAADRLLTNIDATTSDVEQAIAAARAAIDSARAMTKSAASAAAEKEQGRSEAGKVAEGQEFPEIGSEKDPGSA